MAAPLIFGLIVLSDGDFDYILFWIKEHAFVVAIPRHARLAFACVPRFDEPVGEKVDVLLAADGDSQMRPAQHIKRIAFRDIHPLHKFQTGSFTEGNEVRLEVFFFFFL